MSLPAFNHFDMAVLREQLDAMRCPRGHVGYHFIGPASAPHYAEVRCDECGHMAGYMPAPRNIVEQKRRRAQRMPVPIGVDFCWWCNRDALLLTKLGVRLTWAHKRDRAAMIELGHDPGDLDQMRICEWCHSDMERARERAGKEIALFATIAAVTFEPVGIERPMLTPSEKEDQG